MAEPQPATLEIVLKIVQIIVLPVLGYVTFVLRDIRSNLNKLNGRVGKLEEWTRGHEKLDQVRHEDIRRELDSGKWVKAREGP